MRAPRRLHANVKTQPHMPPPHAIILPPTTMRTMHTAIHPSCLVPFPLYTFDGLGYPAAAGVQASPGGRKPFSTVRNSSLSQDALSSLFPIASLSKYYYSGLVPSDVYGCAPPS